MLNHPENNLRWNELHPDRWNRKPEIFWPDSPYNACSTIKNRIIINKIIFFENKYTSFTFQIGEHKWKIQTCCYFPETIRLTDGTLWDSG